MVYGIDGADTPDDLEKRHAVESHFNELLGWTGLGHVDGGHTGSGTMEAGCIVVDPEVAKSVSADDLKGTELGDYIEMTVTRIEPA